MALNLASPGVLVREVDLTIGRVDPTSDKVAGLVGPFANGPVEVPTLVENEQDLLQLFGEPYAVDYQYEYWLTASSFLSYGGALRIVRSDDDLLKNAFVGAASSVKIKSLEHYTQLGYDENTLADVTVAAKNPGSWANGIRVAIIDGKSDQILLGINTEGITVGFGVTQAIDSILAGIGQTSVLDGYLKGKITDIGVNSVEVKVLSHVSASGTESEVDYQPLGVYAFSSGGSVAIHTVGQSSPFLSTSYTTQADWFDEQTIGITTISTVKWNSISNRPSTSAYAASRGSRFDEVHVIVIDAIGKITGNAGTVLEKHLNLSKAKDAEFSAGSASNWRKYLASASNYIFGLSSPAGITTIAFDGAFNSFNDATDTAWDQNAESIKFAACGSNTYTLTGGTNYGGSSDVVTSGSLTSSLTKLSSGYSLFENTDNYDISFLLMGSSNHPKEVGQALANKLISVAEARKDTIAFISPYRGASLTDTSVQTEVTVRNDEDITSNIISFFSSIASSSYAIFDSGYKYMYDRFSETFRYVPLNGDIAGLCARTDINGFPWFSPAGTSRGAILNAVKLAYNPTKSQRDRLYSNRINSIIFSPGSGIVLFGDKTGLAKASAFDRINVRRLFIYLENAISAAAKDQLFEFNDEITRTNFVNIIEPFLRDVQSKRGIFDYVVICDETNNTAAVIDNNEFVADIYIKPARSINYVGLTFVATRTGVAFEEVIGNV